MRSRSPSILVAVLLGLAIAVLSALAPLPDRSVFLDVGDEGPFRTWDETDTVRRMLGFHLPEGADGSSYRWTYDWARLSVPHAHQLGEHLQLHLWMCGCRPEGPQPTVQLSLNNQLIGGLPTSATNRRYAVLVPRGDGSAGTDLFFELRAPTISYTGRDLGVRVDRIDVLAPRAPALPKPAAALAGLVAGLAGLLVVKTAPDRLSRLTLLAALAVGPLLTIALYRHQELTPTALVLAALGGVLFVALARPPALAAPPLAAAALVLPLLPRLLGSWMVDDAFISFRYAQQLVAGQGLVFNPGEYVEGYTNFLWTMIMAAVLWFGGDPVYVSQLLTLLIAQATVPLCYAAGRRLIPGASVAGLVAPLLVATSGPFLLYSARGSGLETALFTLLLLAGVWAYLANQWKLCGALLALAALTRPEGVLVLGLTAGHAWLRATGANRWRRTAALLGAFLIIFVPYYLWRFAYYGLPLPNTFYVKVGASWAQVSRGLRYLREYWSAEGWAWGIGLSVLAVAKLAALRATITPRAPGQSSASLGISHGSFRLRYRAPPAWLSSPHAYLGALALAYLAYIAVVGGDWLPEARFVVPLVPLFALLAQAGLSWLAGRGRVGAVLAAALLALALFDHTRHLATTSAYDPNNLIWNENDTVAQRREYGRWLRLHTPPDTLLAVEAAGALPYYSQRPTIDILGLNDRHIASLEVATIGQGKPGHEKTDIPYVLHRRPDIIPYFAAPYFRGQPDFEQHYKLEWHDGPEGYGVILYRRIGP